MNKHLDVYRLTLGGLYVAIFALAGNIPILSAIQIAGIPLTLQVFLVAMMGLTLGLRGGLAAYASVLLLTLCGLPMMSGGRGGFSVFVSLTGGYILGWFFIVVLLGLYADHGMRKLLPQKYKGMSLHVPAVFVIGLAGVLLDYICGTAGMAAVSGRHLAELPALFLTNLAFLPGDICKIALAAILSLVLFARPVFVRLLPQLKKGG